ncbi:MAG TPA: hypothetical protein PK537_04365 [Candidatus Limiplasma sp.]|nr:hypothetical protein [Candidatus Limiplasma sp.]
MKRIQRIDWWQWLAVAGITVLSAFIFHALLLREQSDIAIHTLWAGQATLSDPKSFIRQAAHPMWRICVFLLMQTGLSANWSALLFTALCKGLETWALIALARRLIGRGGIMAAACGLCAALVASIWVPWVNPTVFVGGGSPNPWHSPTQIALMAPMIVSISYIAAAEERYLAKREILSWKHAAWIAVLLLASALIKPTFLQAFLPAAGLYFLVRWIQNPKGSAYYLRLLAAAAPAILVILLEFLFYFGGIIESQGGITLSVSGEKTLEVLRLVLFTQLFPLFVLLTFTDRETIKKPLFILVLLLDAVAILQMLILSETGYRAQDGNFGWAVMGAALMLWAVTLPLYGYRVSAWIRRITARDGTPHVISRPHTEAARMITGGVLLLWHLAAGIGYIVYLFATTNAL